MKKWKVKLPGNRYFEMASDTPHEDLAAQGYDRYALEEIYQVPPAWKETPSGSGAEYDIPADMLKYTASALYELAIRQRISADGKTAQDAAELLKKAAEVQKAADLYSGLYQRRRGPGMTVFEQLRKDALYAQQSFSKELLYQAHGAAMMARQLGAITHDEAAELNWMTVTFMNTNREYIQHQCEELSAIAQALTVKEAGTA